VPRIVSASPSRQGRRLAASSPLNYRIPPTESTTIGLQFVMTLEVTCPNSEGEICSKVSQKLAPSPASPVDVVFMYAHGLQACLKTVPDGSAVGPGGGEAYLETDAQCRLPTASS
jgi:hypothetical protein